MSKKVDYFKQFLNQDVNVVMEFTRSETQQEGETVIATEDPLVLGGILISYDEEFFYLGDENGEIQQAIPRAKTLALQIDRSKVESEEDKPIRSDMN